MIGGLNDLFGIVCSKGVPIIRFEAREDEIRAWDGMGERGSWRVGTRHC